MDERSAYINPVSLAYIKEKPTKVVKRFHPTAIPVHATMALLVVRRELVLPRYVVVALEKLVEWESFVSTRRGIAERLIVQVFVKSDPKVVLECMTLFVVAMESLLEAHVWHLLQEFL